MGKYVKKGKITGDVAIMEVPQSALGVRTRAKTLALQENPEFCYLQLRNRRLEKPQFPPPSPPKKPEKQEKNKQGSKQSNRSGSHQSQSRKPAGSRLRVHSVNPVPTGPPSFKTEEVEGLVVEGSFGESNLELDGIGRSARESTPCSLIRDVGSTGTPGSAVRSTYSGAVNQQRVQDDSVQRSIPSAREIEDFFANAERQQQQQFMDKYNFDVINDLPLLGRFEWVRVDP